jgi:Holliday junction DNA helicase RuvA
MIGYIRGELLENHDGRYLLAVGGRQEAGCLGYLLQVPQRGPYLQTPRGSWVELFVYSHIREEAFDLYGFHSGAEKALFLTLLSVSGIGPKSALAILSTLEPLRVLQCLAQGDQVSLSKVSGVGKKTAERLVLELKEKIQKRLVSGEFAALQPRSGGAGSSPSVASSAKGPPDATEETLSLFPSAAGGEKGEGVLPFFQHSIFQDAQAALVGLGYRASETHALLMDLCETHGAPFQEPEVLIRKALQRLAQ